MKPGHYLMVLTASSSVVTSRFRTFFTRVFNKDNRVGVHLVQATMILTAWFAIASAFPNDLMPYPIETLEILYGLVLEGLVWQHFLITFQRIIIGVGIALVFGGSIGILMGTSKYVKFANMPYMIVMMTTPSIIWALAAVILIGFGNVSVIFVTVAATIPWTMLYIWKGTENIQTDLIEMASSFHLSPWRIYYRIIVRDVAPDVFGATRLAIGLGFKAIVVAEFIVTNEGIGSMVYNAYEGYRFQEAWAWMLVIFLIIFITEWGLREIENVAFNYRSEGNLAGDTT